MKKIVLLINIFMTIIVISIVFCVLCGIRPYVVLSGSMEPSILTGSICLVDTKADYDCIKEGDVIAYKKGGNTLITHRVISKTREGLVTKGDANHHSDGISVTEHNFTGKTIGSIPYLGYFLNKLRNPIFLISFIGIVTAIKIIKNL